MSHHEEKNLADRKAKANEKNQEQLKKRSQDIHNKTRENGEAGQNRTGESQQRSNDRSFDR